jgi:hypothetical protein
MSETFSKRLRKTKRDNNNKSNIAFCRRFFIAFFWVVSPKTPPKYFLENNTNTFSSGPEPGSGARHGDHLPRFDRTGRPHVATTQRLSHWVPIHPGPNGSRQFTK